MKDPKSKDKSGRLAGMPRDSAAPLVCFALQVGLHSDRTLHAPPDVMGFFGLGTTELIVIMVVLLLFFGKDKLPELARSIGKSFKELKAGFDPSADSEKDDKKEKEPAGAAGKPDA